MKVNRDCEKSLLFLFVGIGGGDGRRRPDLLSGDVGIYFIYVGLRDVILKTNNAVNADREEK